MGIYTGNISFYGTTKYTTLDSILILSYYLQQNGKMFELKNFLTITKRIEWEAVFWIAGLLYLAFINPYQTQQFSICPFHNMGITFCPGCGLGRSISFFYHGDIIHSLKSHPMGIIAFFLISYRIITLSRKMFRNFHKQNEVLYG